MATKQKTRYHYINLCPHFPDSITIRQSQVLLMIEFRIIDIAKTLRISRSTVDDIVATLKRKFNAASKADLITFTQQHTPLMTLLKNTVQLPMLDSHAHQPTIAITGV